KGRGDDPEGGRLEMRMRGVRGGGVCKRGAVPFVSDQARIPPSVGLERIFRVVCGLAIVASSALHPTVRGEAPPPDCHQTICRRRCPVVEMAQEADVTGGIDSLQGGSDIRKCCTALQPLLYGTDPASSTKATYGETADAFSQCGGIDAVELQS